eukprot:8324620-Pyramimonas_sp.AAC.2
MPRGKRPLDSVDARRGWGFSHKRPAIDPMNLLRVLFFARHLHDCRNFSEAMADAREYAHTDAGAARDSSGDPKRSSIARGMERLGIMDLLLLRREFRADCARDNTVAIQLFSDASPTTGTEIQGMVMDVLRRDGSTQRTVLPGCTLLRGFYDAASKAIALLHAIWVVPGPDVETVRYVLSKVVCVTTDFGNEVRTLEMVDCVEAYCKWMGGLSLSAARPFVNRDRRWLPHSI